MYNVKIFKSDVANAHNLEEEINQFLNNNPITIIDCQFQMYNGRVIYVIMYKH